MYLSHKSNINGSEKQSLNVKVQEISGCNQHLRLNAAVNQFDQTVFYDPNYSIEDIAKENGTSVFQAENLITSNNTYRVAASEQEENNVVKCQFISDINTLRKFLEINSPTAIHTVLNYTNINLFTNDENFAKNKFSQINSQNIFAQFLEDLLQKNSFGSPDSGNFLDFYIMAKSIHFRSDSNYKTKQNKENHDLNSLTDVLTRKVPMSNSRIWRLNQGGKFVAHLRFMIYQQQPSFYKQQLKDAICALMNELDIPVINGDTSLSLDKHHFTLLKNSNYITNTRILCSSQKLNFESGEIGEIKKIERNFNHIPQTLKEIAIFARSFNEICFMSPVLINAQLIPSNDFYFRAIFEKLDDQIVDDFLEALQQISRIEQILENEFLYTFQNNSKNELEIYKEIDILYKKLTEYIMPIYKQWIEISTKNYHKIDQSNSLLGFCITKHPKQILLKYPLACEYLMKLWPESNNDDVEFVHESKDLSVSGEFDSTFDSFEHEIITKTSQKGENSNKNKPSFMVNKSEIYLAPDIQSNIVPRFLHKRSREQIYRTFTGTLRRFLVTDDQVDQNFKYDSYRPLDFSSKQSFSDLDPNAISPIVVCDQNSNNIVYNQVDCSLNRRSHEGRYGVLDGRPLNPYGRTGLAGRGLLSLFGPNHRSAVIVTRFKRTAFINSKGTNNNTGNFFLKDNKRILEFIARPNAEYCKNQKSYKEIDNWEIPKFALRAGESSNSTFKKQLVNVLKSMTLKPDTETDLLGNIHKLFQDNGTNCRTIYKGYCDSSINTDNAQLELNVQSFHDDGGSLNNLNFSNCDRATSSLISTHFRQQEMTCDSLVKNNFGVDDINFLKKVSRLQNCWQNNRHDNLKLLVNVSSKYAKKDKTVHLNSLYPYKFRVNCDMTISKLVNKYIENLKYSGVNHEEDKQRQDILNKAKFHQKQFHFYHGTRELDLESVINDYPIFDGHNLIVTI